MPSPEMPSAAKKEEGKNKGGKAHHVNVTWSLSTGMEAGRE